jgi:uncharacterized protein YndB with AHSA1/START domain
MSDGALELRRRIPAPIDEVFRWWTEPDRLREWMTPVGTVDAEVDLRIGGSLRIVMRGEGLVIEHTGEYLEIDPPRRLVFTWRSPYTGEQASLITVELDSDGEDATELRLTHSKLPPAAVSSHQGGWASMLDRLAQRVRPGREVRHGR